MFQYIDVEIDAKIADEIEKRAAALQISPGEYITLALEDVLESNEPAGTA